MNNIMRGMIGGAIGLALGLLVGWVVWPVQYVGEAYTYELNHADKLRYANAVVDSFKLTGIVDPAWFAQWTPDEVNEELSEVSAQPSRQTAAYALGEKLGAIGVAAPAKILRAADLSITPRPSPQKQGTISPTESGEVGNGMTLILCWGIVGVVIAIIVAAVLIFYPVWRRRMREANPTPKASRVRWADAGETTESEEWQARTADGAQAQEAAPLKLWTSTYRQEMEDFDESFHIETQDGMFVGECGMGLVKGNGGGKPDRVAALEVWLFNKIETRDVSQILVSDAAQATATPGLPLMAEQGMTFTMQSGLLSVEVTVVEVEVVEEYFKTLSVTMAARMG